MKDLVVFARSYNEFRYYCHDLLKPGNDNSPNIFRCAERFIYPDRLERLLGLQNPSAVLYDSWYENPKMKQAKKEYEMRYGKI